MKFLLCSIKPNLKKLDWNDYWQEKIKLISQPMFDDNNRWDIGDTSNFHISSNFCVNSEYMLQKQQNLIMIEPLTEESLFKKSNWNKIFRNFISEQDWKIK